MNEKKLPELPAVAAAIEEIGALIPLVLFDRLDYLGNLDLARMKTKLTEEEAAILEAHPVVRNWIDQAKEVHFVSEANWARVKREKNERLSAEAFRRSRLRRYRPHSPGPRLAGETP